jgi:tripartite-type tricarboxylate transporter receptor subunit TctC
MGSFSGRITRGVVAALGLAMLSGAAPADEIADFYRGKSLTLVVSTAAGGGYDLWARLLARHFGRNIPGNPDIVVQNTPGSGGLRVMNMMNTVAARDGSIIAVVHSTAPFTPLLEPHRGRFDAGRFGWIGSMARESSFCLAWGTAAVKTFADLKQHPLIVGSTGAGSHMEIYPRLMNRLFSTRFRIVGGYKGGNDIYLAMERGEAEGRCGVTMPALRNVRPDWIAKKTINFIIQTGLTSGSDPALKGVPNLIDMARNPQERQMMEILFANGEIQVPLFAPPGVPPSRLAALREAFRRTLADPALRAEAAKQRMHAQFVSGEDVERLLARVYATPPAVIKATIAAINEK